MAEQMCGHQVPHGKVQGHKGPGHAMWPEEKSGNTGILRSRRNGRPGMIRQETTAYHRIGEQMHIPNAGTIEWKEPRSMGPEDREELV